MRSIHYSTCARARAQRGIRVFGRVARAPAECSQICAHARAGTANVHTDRYYKQLHAHTHAHHLAAYMRPARGSHARRPAGPAAPAAAATAAQHTACASRPRAPADPSQTTPARVIIHHLSEHTVDIIYSIFNPHARLCAYAIRKASARVVKKETIYIYFAITKRESRRRKSRRFDADSRDAHSITKACAWNLYMGRSFIRLATRTRARTSQYAPWAMGSSIILI